MTLLDSPADFLWFETTAGTEQEAVDTALRRLGLRVTQAEILIVAKAGLSSAMSEPRPARVRVRSCELSSRRYVDQHFMVSKGRVTWYAEISDLRPEGRYIVKSLELPTFAAAAGAAWQWLLLLLSANQANLSIDPYGQGGMVLTAGAVRYAIEVCDSTLKPAADPTMWSGAEFNPMTAGEAASKIDFLGPDKGKVNHPRWVSIIAE